jgi:hypothetical protein
MKEWEDLGTANGDVLTIRKVTKDAIVQKMVRDAVEKIGKYNVATNTDEKAVYSFSPSRYILEYIKTKGNQAIRIDYVPGTVDYIPPFKKVDFLRATAPYETMPKKAKEMSKTEYIKWAHDVLEPYIPAKGRPIKTAWEVGDYKRNPELMVFVEGLRNTYVVETVFLTRNEESLTREDFVYYFNDIFANLLSKLGATEIPYDDRFTKPTPKYELPHGAGTIEYLADEENGTATFELASDFSDIGQEFTMVSFADSTQTRAYYARHKQ